MSDFSSENNETGQSDPPIFVLWVDFLKWLFLTTEKFPKKSRFTIVNKLDNLAINILDQIIEARYSKKKLFIVKNINLEVEKLRVLLRISFELRFMPVKSYEYSMRQLYEAGSMAGGWVKYLEKINEKA